MYMYVCICRFDASFFSSETLDTKCLLFDASSSYVRRFSLTDLCNAADKKLYESQSRL